MDHASLVPSLCPSTVLLGLVWANVETRTEGSPASHLLDAYDLSPYQFFFGLPVNFGSNFGLAPNNWFAKHPGGVRVQNCKFGARSDSSARKNCAKELGRQIGTATCPLCLGGFHVFSFLLILFLKGTGRPKVKIILEKVQNKP